MAKPPAAERGQANVSLPLLIWHGFSAEFPFGIGWRKLSPVEQMICNQPVGGSNPFASSNLWVRTAMQPPAGGR